MKKIFLPALILVITAISSFGQDKVEKYCEMTAQARLFSKKVTIDIDFGEERKFFSFKDTRVKDDLGKVKTFNSVVDALNFLGSVGWKLVNAFPIAESSGSLVYHYYFKREFDASELDTTGSR
jgi:hypothetical protein